MKATSKRFRNPVQGVPTAGSSAGRAHISRPVHSRGSTVDIFIVIVTVVLRDIVRVITHLILSVFCVHASVHSRDAVIVPFQKCRTNVLVLVQLLLFAVQIVLSNVFARRGTVVHSTTAFATAFA